MPQPMTELNDMRKYANALRLQSEKRIEGISQRLLDGEIDLPQWQQLMKDELRRAHLEQFVVGKGGIRDGVKAGDYGKLGPELKKQYQYLNKFAATIAKQSEAGQPLTGIIARSKLYARSTQATFWHTAIPVQLPQYPRDGKTKCKSNCKCRLRFKYVRDAGEVSAVLVWWQLAPAEHCKSCRDLAREWSPKRFEVNGTIKESSIQQSVELLLMESPGLRKFSNHIHEMWGITEGAG